MWSVGGAGVESGGTGVKYGRCWYGVWEVLVWSVEGAGVECGRYMHWCEVWELLMWNIVVWRCWCGVCGGRLSARGANKPLKPAYHAICGRLL